MERLDTIIAAHVANADERADEPGGTLLPILHAVQAELGHVSEDAIRAIIELMEAPAERITIRSSYNLSGMSFTPSELATEIKKHLPTFNKTASKTDYRQQIADSWPESIDDTQARKDWDWSPQFDLPRTVETMIDALKKRYTPPKEDLKPID